MNDRDYRVQVCGWPATCFDAQGRQLYTPQELERAFQHGEIGSCPPGVCIASRENMLTGAYSERDPEQDRRADAQCQPLPRHAAGRIEGGQIEIVQPVEHRSWIEILLGAKR